MFDGVTVIDVQRGRRLPAQRVVVVGHRIRTIGNARIVPIPAGARVVDARGKYLIPGLWDMHTHANQRATLLYPLFIANGVTGIRDASSSVPLKTLRLWRHEILAGTRVGPPRQLLSGAAIDDSAFGCIGGPENKSHLCVSTPAAARATVDSLKATGADIIKTYNLSRPTYFVVAAEARHVGVPFGGHLSAETATAIEASDSGARILDHSLSKDLAGKCLSARTASEAQCSTVAEHFRHNNTWWVPTLFIEAYAPRLLRESMLGFGGGSGKQSPTNDLLTRINTFATAFWRGTAFRPEQLRDAIVPLFGDTVRSVAAPELGSVLRIPHQVKLPILAGTDVNGQALSTKNPALGMAGFVLHAELAMYVDRGLTPLEALQSATLNPAKLLGATDSLGTVASGKLADLVLLDADPLVDISNTTMIRAVVANGRYFDRSALDQLVAEAQSAVPGVTVTTVTPGTEPLHVLLAREADSAAAHGQLALVDMGTRSCEICQVFHRTLTDSVMIAALRGAWLIEADLDAWSFKATTDGFAFSGALPILFVATPEGREGAVFNHTAWDEQLKKLGAPAVDGRVLGPPLQAFLAHVRDSVAKAK